MVEEDLLEVLQEKRIRKAVLDVFSVEPLHEESPFWTLENCIVTPHISGCSNRYLSRCLEILQWNLQAFREGKSLINVVDCEKGY